MLGADLRNIADLPIPVPDDEAGRLAVEEQAAKVVSALEALNRARTPHERTRRERAARDARAQLERQVSALLEHFAFNLTHSLQRGSSSSILRVRTCCRCHQGL